MPNLHVKLSDRHIHVGKNRVYMGFILPTVSGIHRGSGNRAPADKGGTAVFANMVLSHCFGGWNYEGSFGCPKNLGAVWDFTGRRQGTCAATGTQPGKRSTQVPAPPSSTTTAPALSRELGLDLQ